jgi:RimJ/RimL family protein N-acetyltransferase
MNPPPLTPAAPTRAPSPIRSGSSPDPCGARAARRRSIRASRSAAGRRRRSPVGPRPLVARLRDGSTVEIRELVPADRALVAETFARLSAQSRYMRFLSPMPTLPSRMLDALMDVDQDRHVALIAMQDGEPVGIVRYVRDAADPAVADLSVTVIDARQGRGLGRVLLTALRRCAAERGVHELHLDVHPENRRMAALARSLGARLSLRDGLLSGRMPTFADADASLRSAA